MVWIWIIVGVIAFVLFLGYLIWQIDKDSQHEKKKEAEWKKQLTEFYERNSDGVAYIFFQRYTYQDRPVKDVPIAICLKKEELYDVEAALKALYGSNIVRFEYPIIKLDANPKTKDEVNL